VVEGQHVVSTRKLVDSLAEQELLEEMIEGVKPRLPERPEFRGLHYLLSTPFRHPPLRYGSRFGSRDEPSLWYGAVQPRTAFAESAYYRLLFLAGTEADLGTLEVELTLFDVRWRSSRAVDLTRSPFESCAEHISSPKHYSESQALGREMRADGVQAARYKSARDSHGGLNLALFSPIAFAEKRPGKTETWHCVATRSAVEFVRRDFFERARMLFDRSEFELDGVLPQPAP
jgi:hypothetical protein